MDREFVAPVRVKTENVREQMWADDGVIPPGGGVDGAGSVARRLITLTVPNVCTVSEISPPKFHKLPQGGKVVEVRILVTNNDGWQGRQMAKLFN